MRLINKIIPILFIGLFHISAWGQQDSLHLLHQSDSALQLTNTKQKASKDTIIPTKRHIPQLATKRSALIPGWGQAYNREYWKIPIVYAAIGIPAYAFFFNDSYYKKTKYAYEAVFAASQGDSSKLSAISPDVLNSDGSYLKLSTYQTARNYYRRNRDYSVLYFLLMWGLNVVDATVFGHLKNFDVTDDLSMHLQPTFQLTPTTQTFGVSVVMSFKNPNKSVKNF